MSTDDLPGRDETDGRGHGAGSWLENETVEAFEEWGYYAERGGIVWGQEVDVVATGGVGGSGRFLCQCKDWQKQVTPSVMWRLIALSHATRCRPVLVTTSTLTNSAVRIARNWRVRVLTIGDLWRPDFEDVPGPEHPVEFNERGEPIAQWSNEEWTTRLEDSEADRLLTAGEARYEYLQRAPMY